MTPLPPLTLPVRDGMLSGYATVIHFVSFIEIIIKIYATAAGPVAPDYWSHNMKLHIKENMNARLRRF